MSDKATAMTFGSGQEINQTQAPEGEKESLIDEAC